MTAHLALMAAVIAFGLLGATSSARAQGDADVDGVDDALDNCVNSANTNQRDTNLDGFGNRCDADYDNNGVVGTVYSNDYWILNAAFGSHAGDPNWNPDVDCNGDGVISSYDSASCYWPRIGTAPGASGHACAGSFPCPCVSQVPFCAGGIEPGGQSPRCSYTPPSDLTKTYNDCSEPNPGPRVLLESTHNNFYLTRSLNGGAGLYQPFAELLTADGIVIVQSGGDLATHLLTSAGPDILVMAGPTAPLSESEANTVNNWILEGGSLLLIVDHSPYNEVFNLVPRFFPNFLLPDETNQAIAGAQGEPYPFVINPTTTEGTLRGDSVVACESAGCDDVQRVETFGGNPFCPVPALDELGIPFFCGEQNGPDRDSLLILPTPFSSPSGYEYSHNVMGFGFCHGQGRVYVSGEGAMFTSQVATYFFETWTWGLGGSSYSNIFDSNLNSATLNDNERLLLNIIHWLDGMRPCPGQS